MGTQFTFERSEKKYIVDIITAEQVKNAVANFLSKEWHNGTDISFVRSVYLDNDSWKSYLDYRTDKKSRFKVRMRQYGVNGVYTKRCFFELKEKLDFMTFKKRLQLKQKWARKFLEGDNLLPKLTKYNKELATEQLTDIYREIWDHIMSYNLLPAAEILYQREAFEDEQRVIRITFDRHLSYKALPLVHHEPIKLLSRFPNDQVVIEIKTIIEWPDWLNSIPTQFDLIAQRFSKYATAVEELFMPELQPVLIPLEIKQKEKIRGAIC